VDLSAEGRGNVDARFSYRGRTDATVIAARAFEYCDDFVPGIVDFSNFLSAPESMAPGILNAVTISPSNPTIASGQSKQFVATEMFSDSTTIDPTAAGQ
jgi:hypothetical protein